MVKNWKWWYWIFAGVGVIIGIACMAIGIALLPIIMIVLLGFKVCKWVSPAFSVVSFSGIKPLWQKAGYIIDYYIHKTQNFCEKITEDLDNICGKPMSRSWDWLTYDQ